MNVHSGTEACLSVSWLGISFMQVGASDRDDRNTAHADLRFSLMDQTPRIPSSHMFFIDSVTGEVSLTEDGELQAPHSAGLFYSTWYCLTFLCSLLNELLSTPLLNPHTHTGTIHIHTRTSPYTHTYVHTYTHTPVKSDFKKSQFGQCWCYFWIY